MLNLSVSIIGCGWLGLPLAKQLITQGYAVKGTTTTPAKIPILQEAGIEPFLLSLTPQTTTAHLASVLSSQSLIVNIPPGGRQQPDVINYHYQQMQVLHRAACASGIGRVILVSSTSVYAPLNRLVTEADINMGEPDSESGKALRKVEQLWLTPYNPFQTTILRMAGLAGGSRQPGKFLAGKTNLPNANAPVNLVHLTDSINVICRVLEQPALHPAYNICSDEHPTRKELYTRAARQLGLEPPQFSDAPTQQFNLIDNALFKQTYQFTYTYPNPSEFK